jgi:hypothetical protein
MGFLRSIFPSRSATSEVNPAQPAKPITSGKEMMGKLRLGWLTNKPGIGSGPNGQGSDSVSAALVDWPLNGNIVTILGSSVGDGSVYTTSTFGIIGGIGHERVRNAAMAFTSAAQRHLALSAPTTDFSYPTPGQIRFFFVTPSGVRSVTFTASDVEIKGSASRELFAHGQQVLTELRLIGPKIPEKE